MALSSETKNKINSFAKQQAVLYLEDAEMTYLEQLRQNAGGKKDGAYKKLSKFKANSEKSIEAREDMALYMSDYIEDLVAGGMPEEDAFKKAKTDLALNSKTPSEDDLQERFLNYYMDIDPAQEEVTGLFYGGFIILGMTIGALIGFIFGGGVQGFLEGGYVYAAIGFFAGILLGTGLGLIANAVVSFKKNIA